MSYFLNEFGKKIKGYRELCGYSQEKLGELVDVSTKTIAFWEMVNHLSSIRPW